MVSVRVDVEPRMLQWAMERSGRGTTAAERFPVEKWIAGERRPTLRQLENFATATKTPLGALLLPEPPTSDLPLTDYRTFADRQTSIASPELEDAVLLIERRQEWLRQRRLGGGAEPLTWIASFEASADPAEVAADAMARLDFEVASRPRGPLLDTRAALVEALEREGVLVTLAGFVGSTRRVFDLEEFRGFCLVDDIVPAVFVNARDSKAGQLFTLLHEYAHLLLGQSALDLPDHGAPSPGRIERWCNEVAAEALVPRGRLAQVFDASAALEDEVRRLHGLFRASGLVILSQLLSIQAISWQTYEAARDAERAAALAAMASTSEGGNYYNTKPHMIGRPLLAAVAAEWREGRTTTTEAMSLLQIRSYSTLEQLVDKA